MLGCGHRLRKAEEGQGEVDEAVLEPLGIRVALDELRNRGAECNGRSNAIIINSRIRMTCFEEHFKYLVHLEADESNNSRCGGGNGRYDLTSDELALQIKSEQLGTSQYYYIVICIITVITLLSSYYYNNIIITIILMNSPCACRQGQCRSSQL